MNLFKAMPVMSLHEFSPYQRCLWIIGALILLASAIGCSNKDPLSLLMEDLEESAEARDVDAFEKHLASNFTGNDTINREEAIAVLRRYFAAYEQIRIDVTKMKRASQNQLSFHVTFSGKVNAPLNLQNLFPSSSEYQFELQLVQEEGALKVQKAFWQELASPRF
jgi:hypothetical protein